MDTTDVSFQQAYAKKVKVLMYTGLADDGVSPYNTIQFYDRLVGDLGQKKVDKFLRFYTVPGFSHGFGPFSRELRLADGAARHGSRTASSRAS